MKLFLTSQANVVLDKIVPKLPQPPQEMTIAFIPTAGDPYESTPWLIADRAKLVELGFQVFDFDLKDKTEEQTRGMLASADIIFVGGGNTFYLLEKSIASGFVKVVKELVANGKIYIGSSAGSCITGPDLEPIAPIDRPENAHLETTKAFGLVNFAILPHHGREKYDPVHEKVLQEFGDRYKLVTLTDEQFIVSDGEKFEIK